MQFVLDPCDPMAGLGLPAPHGVLEELKMAVWLSSREGAQAHGGKPVGGIFTLRAERRLDN